MERNITIEFYMVKKYVYIHKNDDKFFIIRNK